MVEMTEKDVLNWARGTFEIEQRILREVSESLDASFVQAVELMASVTQKKTGNVIVSGVGKSGIVARKWAATLSSTGTPAYFINPVEAAHGDLGSIRKDDVVVLLSFSGETQELGHIVRYSSENDMPLVVVTSSHASTLAKQAAISLEVVVSQEACPLGLAPTASTTAMMALGDAFAVSLMKLQGFSAEDFARFHPGGNLGRRYFQKVSEVMHQGDSIPQVAPVATMEETILEITQKKLGAALVVEDGRLMGIVTDGDLRRFMQEKKSMHETSVGDVMTANPKKIGAQELAFQSRMLMEENKITQLPVVDSAGKVQGILHIHDLSS